MHTHTLKDVSERKLALLEWVYANRKNPKFKEFTEYKGELMFWFDYEKPGLKGGKLTTGLISESSLEKENLQCVS